jgi:hypothetical protein
MKSFFQTNIHSDRQAHSYHSSLLIIFTSFLLSSCTLEYTRAEFQSDDGSKTTYTGPFNPNSSILAARQHFASLRDADKLPGVSSSEPLEVQPISAAIIHPNLREANPWPYVIISAVRKSDSALFQYQFIPEKSHDTWVLSRAWMITSSAHRRELLGFQ